MTKDPVSTLTVDELIARLTKFPHDTKVYMSCDGEGNGYSTLDSDSFSIEALDEVVILFPATERLEYDAICPKESEAEEQI